MIIHVYDDDLLNGVGLREVVFLQGCHHHCKGCFSPETWKFKKNTKSSIARDKAYTEQLKKKLQKPYIDGITITGGDPMAKENQSQTLYLCRLAKKYNKSVWIYTGYLYEDLLKHKGIFNKVKNFFFNTTKQILKNTDVIIDGKFEEDFKSPDKPWVGSSNQRVVDIQNSLKENKTILLYD